MYCRGESKKNRSVGRSVYETSRGVAREFGFRSAYGVARDGTKKRRRIDFFKETISNERKERRRKAKTWWDGGCRRKGFGRAVSKGGIEVFNRFQPWRSRRTVRRRSTWFVGR